MALTRIKASQISNLDYKQACRVLTATNITLSGGAPSTVDGVNLNTGDRILVKGQSSAAQNGLYVVQTLGTGSDGTWVRSVDANTNGEIRSGMVVMITDGNTYADTPWKLVTNGAIDIGVTELTFEENYSQAFGNIYANGTAVLASTVSASISLETGNNISISGNNGSKTVSISTTNNIEVPGNVTGNVLIGNSIQTDNFQVDSSLSIGNQIIYAQGSNGFSVNENFDAGNSTVTAYHYTSGSGRNAIVFDTAVTGQFTTGFGTTGNAASNKFVFFAEFGNTIWEWRKSVGIKAPNLNGGTLLANVSQNGDFYAVGNITTPKVVKTTATVFSSLPSASDAGAGSRAFVTDSTTNTFLAVAAGGGGNAVPVVSNGTDWLVG